MNNFITKLSNKAYNDEYLITLIYQLEKNYCNKLLDEDFTIKLSYKELCDLMRFADILCRSSKDEHKNLSLRIVSLVYEFEELLEDKFIKLSIINVLTKLGNFPSINLIGIKDENTGIDEIDLDLIVKRVYNESPIKEIFTDEQLKIFNELQTNNHFSFSGSTSFGKSFIFEAFTKYLIDEHNQSDNIAFIVPTKALINQVSFKIRKLVKSYSYKVINSPEIPKVIKRQDSKYIFVFTPERLIAYFLDTTNPKIDYLFVDEAHKLLSVKDTRTPLMYHALVMAKRKSINIFFASPNIPNPSVFLELVNNTPDESYAVKVDSVSQNKFFINCHTDSSFMVSNFGKDIEFPKFNFSGNCIEDLKIILDTFSKNRQSIIYCNTVDKTISTAFRYSKMLEDIVDDDIYKLIDIIDEKVHEKYYLKYCLKKGIAYHFGGIPEEIKIKIEELYRLGKIKLIFCTSTLLEGVNLPAKNIFILSENIGRIEMTDVDFWNLAGRAGRLSKDLAGNIFCVNLYNQQGYWNDDSKIKILRDKNIDETKPIILRKNNKNLYKNIANYYTRNDYTNKKLSEDDKKIIEMYGNILLYHDTVNSDSVLKDRFIDSGNNSLDVLKKIRNENSVPGNILAESIDIDIEIQNRVFKGNKEKLPTETTYEGCYKVLRLLCEEYDWLSTESKGNYPMIRSKEQLSYYATLMEGWINSKPLKYLIQKTISYYYNSGESKEISLRKDGKIYYMKFDKNNALHINTLINNLIKNLENNIKYKIKTYVSNYQSILRSCGVDLECDWEEYIDYGTTNPQIIDIQNLGFSRTMAIFLMDKYYNLFIRNDIGEIIDIDDEKLRTSIDKKKYDEEYKELNILFEWEK
ncbi:DEAD/DEAH box helicase [Ezakiella coagulans]|uniref:DEAD/DEAH box helicase n=1 Tax=Ezakiella coagulans TaxID=46507 RepID=UPI002014B55A|nr:DEAD/DEAH box helicase [Ezakiella coagulans]UQK60678.1 DEAD/DEAH box helicase [Ezakiella coagulans]